MQAHLNNATQEQNSEGEVISFYGDLVSMSPKDADFHLAVVEGSTVLSYVKEYNESKHFTMMYAEKPIPEDLQKDILSVNPHTQFVHIGDIEEFANYYDNGSKAMDRELHPVESVKMLAREDVLFYDVKEREIPEVEEKQPLREYMKPTDISFREGMSDLTVQINEITASIGFDDKTVEKTQNFLDAMGLKGYDASNSGTQQQVTIAKINLHQEFNRDYTVPISGKATIENLDVMLPSKAGKSVADAIEFTHDLIGDSDPGKLKLEFECTDLSDCHIKGAYREMENERTDDKSLSKVDENGVILENNASKSPDEMVSYISKNIEVEQTNTQSFDSSTKAQEIVANMNLPEYDNSIENNDSRGMGD